MPVFTGMTGGSTMVEFKPISYEAVTVGEEFRSDDFLIKPEDVETYAYAVDDHHPWFFERSPFGGKIAHPTLLANQALLLRHSRYIIPAGLHAKMQFEFVEPLRAGMRVRTYGKVLDKYERRERHYMVTQFETRDEQTGQVLVRGQFTQMIFPASGVHRE
jgi:acyl dehydratase